MLIGYSLAHNQEFLPIFGQSLSIIPRLREQGLVAADEQVVIGQKCLLGEYQKLGIMGKLDRILYTHLSTGFQHYLASVSVVNPNSLSFVERSGYKEVYNSGERKYFLAPIRPSSLDERSYIIHGKEGAVIRLRFATISDIPALARLNHDWMKENRDDLSHGYLGALFAPADWEFMIARNWVILAETE